MKRFVFGVALLGVIMVSVWMIGVTDRDETGSVAPREEIGGAAASEEIGGTATAEGDDGLASGEDNGGTGSADDTESAPSPEESGGLPSPAEPATPDVEPIYPRIRSLVRLKPSAYRTNADSLTWRITFTEAVNSVDKSDFVIIGIGPWSLTVTKVGELGDAYDIMLAGDDLADHNGTVMVGIAPGSYIKNLDGNRLLNVNAEGLFEASFVIDNAAPTVALKPENGKIGDAGGNLTLTFSESVYSDPIRTAFTEAMLAGLIDLREDDESGARIPFTASIDQDNATVTIDPTGLLPAQTWVRVNDGYYDTVGNEGAATTAAFSLDNNPADGDDRRRAGHGQRRVHGDLHVQRSGHRIHSVRGRGHQRHGERAHRGTGRPAVARADHADRRLQRDVAGRPGDRPGRQRQRRVDQP